MEIPARRIPTWASGLLPALYALATCVVSTLLTLMALELGTRLMAPQLALYGITQPDPRYYYRMKPHVSTRQGFPGTSRTTEIRTNAWGFRDDEIPPKDGKSLRTLFIGDSYTFGFGVEVNDRFDRCMASAMRARDIAVTPINTGQPGWGLVQASQFTLDHIAEFAPDIVVYTFCENDPGDDARFIAGPPAVDVFDFSRPIPRFFRVHSHLYRLVLQRLAARQAAQQRLKVPPESIPAAHADVLIRSDEWDAMKQRIVTFSEKLRQINPRCVLIVQATDAEDAPARQHFAALDNGTTLRYHDLGGLFRSVPMNELLDPNTFHWNTRVNRLVGESLCRFISEQVVPYLRNYSQ